MRVSWTAFGRRGITRQDRATAISFREPGTEEFRTVSVPANLADCGSEDVLAHGQFYFSIWKPVERMESGAALASSFL